MALNECNRSIEHISENNTRCWLLNPNAQNTYQVSGGTNAQITG